MVQSPLYSNTLPVQALVSAARTNGTVNGVSVDLGSFANDFRTALFVIQAATITDGTHVFKLQESADGSTGWTDVPAPRVQGAPVSLASANSNSVAALGYIAAGVQFVRLVATTTGATTGGVFSAVAVLGEGSVAPVARS
jgi:hypothetical protein